METIRQGDTTTLTFTITDEDSNALDLTGSDIFFTIKSSYSDADDDAVFTKDFSFSGDGSDGVVEIEMTSEETDALSAGIYLYDLQVITSGGSTRSIPTGRIEVVSDITNRTS